MSEPKELRYPMTVKTLAELRQAVHECPPWAVGKFAVDFDGRRMSYERAHQVCWERATEKPDDPPPG